MLRLLFVFSALLWTVTFASAHDPQDLKTPPGEARYIVNAGVVVSQKTDTGESKILFDPLPLSGFGTYPDLPDAEKKSMMSGEVPYDGIDAVFISHAHSDHFSALDMNRYMAAQPEVRLFAPAQAIDAMKKGSRWDEGFESRITAIALEYGDGPAKYSISGLDISAVRIPHSGWPERTEIENLVFRVTLNDNITVAHMGDADINPVHYAPYAKHWQQAGTDMAFPPFWIYLDPDGDEVLEIMNVRQSVGVHVPIKGSDKLKASGADFFFVSGESRSINPAAQTCAPVTFEAVDFTVCTVERTADIRLFWGDEADKPFGNFSKLSKSLEGGGETLVMAMNGGMYKSDRKPVGYYVEDGTQGQNLMTKASYGNFGLLPNGVFYVDETGAHVSETLNFKAAKPDVRFATQSGPMLVIDGQLHPRFRKNSSSRKRRNGVGVTGDKVYFVISEAPVNFHHFGRLFRDKLKTPNALFLDGVISRLYDPESGRNDAGLSMGPIVGVVASQP